VLPAGTKYVRVRITGYTAAFGGPVDNVALIADDAELPTGTMSGSPTSGHAPVEVAFTSTCSDPDGCAAVVWSFGDAPENAGGSSAVGADPAFTYPQNRTYVASATLADARGAARTLYQTVTFTNSAPTTSVTASVASGPAPLAVTFDAHAADDFGITSYSWSFGDGTTSSDAAPSHTFTSAGTYVVRVTVVDTDGVSASSAMTIVATGSTYLVDGDFDADGAGWVFTGNGCSFEGPIAVDNAAHDRTLRGGCGNDVWQVAAVPTASLTSLRLRLDVRPYQDFGTLSMQLWASVSSPDAMTLVGTHTFDSGALTEDLALTGATTSPAHLWYAWTSDDVLAALPPGTTFVKVVFGGFGGPWGAALIDNVALIADDADVPSGELSATPTSGDAPLLVDFTAGCTDLSGSCVGTTWDFGDAGMFSAGGSSTLTAPAYTYVGNQTYTVALVVEDDDGAARTVLASISTVNAPPTASAAGSPLVGPGPLTVTFDGTATDSDGAIASVAWSFGDGATSALEDPTHTYAAQGTYVVTFTATDNEGAFASDALVVIVQ
jgi:PKD repeat protein